MKGKLTGQPLAVFQETYMPLHKNNESTAKGRSGDEVGSQECPKDQMLSI